jgi:hypothetical protein
MDPLDKLLNAASQGQPIDIQRDSAGVVVRDVDAVLQEVANLNTQNMEQRVSEAKSELSQPSPQVTLEGINAPEFEQTVVEEEPAWPFENTRRPSSAEPLKEDHYFMDHNRSTQPSQAEPLKADASPEEFEWDEECSNGGMMTYEDTNRVLYLSIDRLYDFSARTKNALIAAGVRGLTDLHGLAQADLLALKGFGKNSLEEIFNLFAKHPDLDLQSLCNIRKRRPRKGKYEDSPEYTQYRQDIARFEQLSGQFDVYVDELKKAKDSDSVAVEPEAEPVVDLDTQDAEPIVDLGTQDAEHVVGLEIKEVSSESALERSITETLTRPKILVIGASVSGNIDVQNFETVYAQQIEAVKTRHNVKSISLVEYAKGWADLSALVAESGWGDAQAIRLTRFARQEIIAVMSEIADIVVES